MDTEKLGIKVYRYEDQVMVTIPVRPGTVINGYVYDVLKIEVGWGIHHSDHSWYDCHFCKAMWLEEYPEDKNGYPDYVVPATRER